jgi:hypothetical protein
MTHVRILLAGCFALALVSVAGAAGPSTQPSDTETENAQLRQRVAALEAQVKSLEDQVARLKRREGNLIIPRVPSLPQAPRMPYLPYRYDGVAPTPQPQPQQPGREWIPRRFDGRTYYIVPCTPTNDGTPATR